MLEIGAGLGSLTLALAETRARVGGAVETDRHLVPVLRSVVEPAGVEVVEGDALTLDLSRCSWPRGDRTLEPGGQPALQRGDPPRAADAGRGAARSPSCSSWSSARWGSGMAAAPGEPRLRGGVGAGRLLRPGRRWSGGCPPSVFVPRPRVESVLVRHRAPHRARRWTRRLVSYERLDTVVRAGFAPATQDASAVPGGRRRARGLRPRRRAARRPGRGAERRVGEAGGAVTPKGRSGGDAVHRWLAPAKLTVSLRVTGVRPTATTSSTPRW